MSSGVCVSRIKSPEPAKERTIRIPVKIPPLTRAVASSSLSVFNFPPPKNEAMSTEVPSEMPTMKKIRMFMMGPAAPTAASASFPLKRPTMTESAVW